MTAKSKPKTKSDANVRIVPSISKLADLLGVHRQTVSAWIKDSGMPYLTKTPRAGPNGGYDFTFDLKQVFEWRHDIGHEEGRLLGAKGSSSTAAAADGLAMRSDESITHPVTGVTITMAEVLFAEKRQIIANAKTAEHREQRENVKTLAEKAAVALCEDILSNHRYIMTMVTAALMTMADTNRREFEELGMHPDEARRKANAPIEDMARYLAEASPFGDPLAATQEADDEDQPGVVGPDEGALEDDEGFEPDVDDDGFAEDDAGDTAGAEVEDDRPLERDDAAFTLDGDPVE